MLGILAPWACVAKLHCELAHAVWWPSRLLSSSRDLLVELDALVHHPDQANTAWGDVHRTHMFSCAGVVRARAGACLAKLRNDEMTR